MLTIYTYSGNTRAVVNPEDNSELVSEIMGVDVFNLQFSSPLPITFRYGDFITLDNIKYRLNTPEKLTKKAGRDYEYSMTFDSPTQQFGKCLYLFLDSTNRFTETEFSITGTAMDFLNLLVKNLNRLYPEIDYQVGSVVESKSETLDFEGNNCLEVLGMLAEKFETEWFVDGNKVSLYKRQINSGHVLKYGMNEGLYEMTIEPQTNSNPITRVYGYGSDRNLGSSYRNGARRLRMRDSLYLEKNTGLENGSGKYDVIEIRKIFEDVFPRRNGSVTSVTSPFIFSDSSMDFNVNSQLMPDVKAKITFNSGQLSGNSFELSSYNNSTKTFTIVKNTDDQTIEIPSAQLKPAIGDTYVIEDIIMPVQYIINAEAELQAKVQEFIDKASGDIPLLISVICDPIYFRDTGRKIRLGEVVTIQDDIIGINQQIRVIGFTRNYRYPSRYTLKLAENVKDKSIIKIINAA